MPKSTLNLLSITLHGIRNLGKPVTIDYYSKKTLANFDMAGERVKLLYGPNGAGKSSFVLGVWLISQMMVNSSLFSYLGNDFFDKQLNLENPSFEISLVFAFNPNAEIKESLRAYRYSVSIGKDGGEYVICKEHFERLKGKRLSGDYSTIFLAEKGVLEVFPDFMGQETTSEIKNVSMNIIRQQLFVGRLMRYLLSSSKKGLFFNYYNSSNEKAVAIEGLIEFLLNLKVYVGIDDQHMDLAMINGQEWSGETKSSNATTASRDKYGFNVPYEFYPVFSSSMKGMVKFIRLFKPELKDILIKKEIGARNTYNCSLSFVYPKYKVGLDYESTGIKRLFLIYNYLLIASKGGIVLIDELDANIAGVYLERLAEYMNEYGEGQLFFTAHSLEPMKALAKKAKSIFFIGSDNEVSYWVNNAHYQPFNAYPNGSMPGIPFNISSFDYCPAFDLEDKSK